MICISPCDVMSSNDVISGLTAYKSKTKLIQIFSEYMYPKRSKYANSITLICALYSCPLPYLLDVIFGVKLKVFSIVSIGNLIRFCPAIFVLNNSCTTTLRPYFSHSNHPQKINLQPGVAVRMLWQPATILVIPTDIVKPSIMWSVNDGTVIWWWRKLGV